MEHWSDTEYKITKNIKLGKISLSNKYEALINLINRKFDVTVLNICIDSEVTSNFKLRIGIILEFHKDYSKFIKNYNFDELKQNQIISSILDLNLLPKLFDLSKYNKPVLAENIFVYFDCFEDIAKEEVIERINLKKIKEAILSFKIKKIIWKIEIEQSKIVIFMFKKEQVELLHTSGLDLQIKEKIVSLVLQQDIFGYLKSEDIQIIIDSKENLDLHYEGNLFYYFRQ